jgi:hypothetical protein
MAICREQNTGKYFAIHLMVIGRSIYKVSAIEGKLEICGCRIVAITSAFQADDEGSIPSTRSRNWALGINAHIAQSVEHFLGKEEVSGSNPDMSSISRCDG